MAALLLSVGKMEKESCNSNEEGKENMDLSEYSMFSEDTIGSSTKRITRAMTSKISRQSELGLSNDSIMRRSKRSPLHKVQKFLDVPSKYLRSSNSRWTVLSEDLATNESRSGKNTSRTSSSRGHVEVQQFSGSLEEDFDNLKRKYGIEDFVIKLDDLLESEVAKKMWKINIKVENENRSVVVTETGPEQQFVIDSDGLGGTIISLTDSPAKVEQGKFASSLCVEEQKYSDLEASQTSESPPHKRRKKIEEKEFSNCTVREWDALEKSSSLSADLKKANQLLKEGEYFFERESEDQDEAEAGALSSAGQLSLNSWESSDEEEEPEENVGLDKDGMYEVERILARRKNDHDQWLYYIKWTGWPYKRSTWQLSSTFGNVDIVKKEFLSRQKLLSVVLHHEEQWSDPRKLSQLHSLMRWENEINTILRSNNQQILYICNEVDYTRRKRDFTYITKNKLSPRVEAYVRTLNCTQTRCSCKTEECGRQGSCCPAKENVVFMYTKHRGILSRHLTTKNNLVECYGCECSIDCPTKILQNGRRYKVAIVRTKQCGWGVFALENIPSNSFVVEYVGEVLTVDEGNARGDRTYQFELDGSGEVKHMIDARYFGNEAAFINHSCMPNLSAYCVRVERFDQSLHRIGLFSTCRISRGDELTLNYFEGNSLQKETITPEEGTTKCFCSSANCMRYWPICDKSNNHDADNCSDEIQL